MYKHVIAVTMLIVALVVSPSIASAQQGVQDNFNSQTPTNQNSPQTDGTTVNQDEGFNWWWLLPLLAVPLLFLIKRSDKKEDRSINRDQRLAGLEGGEAKKHRDNNF